MSDNIGKKIEPATIMCHAGAVIPAFAMLAGMQLDVFTPLKDGPMNVEELAKELDVQPDKLSPLLYALVMADLLNVEDGLFSNTEESSRFLVHGSSTYMGELKGFYNRRWNAVFKSAESIRTGKPQSKRDWHELSRDELFEVLSDLHPGALAAGRYLAEKYDFAGFKYLLDAGGGTGGLAIGLCESCSDLKATVADLPGVTSISNKFLSDSNMSDRINVTDRDLTESSPKGIYDVAVLRALIQTLSPNQAKSVLKNIGKSMKSGGSIYILGYVTDDTQLYPSACVNFNLHALNIYNGGQAFTERKHREWLNMAGFTDILVEYEAMPYGLTIVSARKA